MTKEFKALMCLVGAAAQGKGINELPNDLNWTVIESLANEQAVQTLLGYALRLSPELRCPFELREKLVAQMRQTAFSNSAWKSSTMQLLKEIREAGIHALLIKGYAVANCYAAPDTRLSGDVDIWIRSKDEKRACAFMKTKGFSVKNRRANEHHDVFQHPQLGCVELHVMLYDELVGDVWFRRTEDQAYVQEPDLEVSTPDGWYYTLGYTDHLIFLMLHLIKHFIQSGLSLRMMMDVTLFYIQNMNKIDSARVWKTMQSLKYETLVQCILCAMSHYCGIGVEVIKWQYSELSGRIDMILDDLESGGWLGKKSKSERAEGWYEYNRQVLLKKWTMKQYLFYMLRWKTRTYIKSIFPNREVLMDEYPCVQNRHILIPFVWLHRLVFRGICAIKDGILTDCIVVNPDEIGTEGEKRIKMFEMLGMLD